MPSMDWWMVFLFVQPIHNALALTCLQCKGISQPRHCKFVDVCYPGEVCGVEKVTNSFGDIVFNIGCVTTSKCQNSSLSQRRSITEGCSECCQSDLCNAMGCGEPGYPQNRGPVCFRCLLQTHPDTCHAIEVCEPGDVCSHDVRKEFGDVVYTSDCSSTHGKCIYSVLNRKRNTVKCFNQPCVHGKCYENQEGFVCVCDRGYEGQLCENKTDHCRSNPCAHGRCVSNALNYKCICESAFAGEACETAAITASDCYDIFKNNISKTSGVYSIVLWRSQQVIDVYCDMDTYPYGWTVFQKRYNGSVDFYRNFTEYQYGFGNPGGEYWIGLRYLEEIAAPYERELRIDLTAADSSHTYEVYQNFSLSPYPNFTLHVGAHTVKIKPGSYHGFSDSIGKDFSTFDHDVDGGRKNCAKDYHGGWWYSYCAYSNLNGDYLLPPGGKSSYEGGLGGFIYFDWQGSSTLQASKMMLRRHS